MKSILGRSCSPPTIPKWYQKFCEKSITNNDKNKAIRIGNSNIRIHSNSNDQ